MEQGDRRSELRAGGWGMAGGLPWAPGRRRDSPVPVAQNGILLYRRLAVGKPTVGTRGRLEFSRFRASEFVSDLGFRAPNFHPPSPSPLPQGAERAQNDPWPVSEHPPLHGERAGVRGVSVAASVRRRKTLCL